MERSPKEPSKLSRIRTVLRRQLFDNVSFSSDGRGRFLERHSERRTRRIWRTRVDEREQPRRDLSSPQTLPSLARSPLETSHVTCQVTRLRVTADPRWWGAWLRGRSTEKGVWRPTNPPGPTPWERGPETTPPAPPPSSTARRTERRCGQTKGTRVAVSCHPQLKDRPSISGVLP